MHASKKPLLTLLAFSCATGLLAGCGGNQASVEETHTVCEASADITDDADRNHLFPDTYLITEDNYFDYQPGLECAAFSSAYVLRHFGEEADGLELFEGFPGKLPDGNGVYPSGVKQFWDDLEGYSADFKNGGTVEELKGLVSTGVPVIVFIHEMCIRDRLRGVHRDRQAVERVQQ